MKLIKGIVLSEIGDDYIAVPMEAAAERFGGIIRLNKTGRDIIQGMINGLEFHEIAEKLVEDYDGVNYDTAMKAVESMAEKLQAEGLMTE